MSSVVHITSFFEGQVQICLLNCSGSAQSPRSLPMYYFQGTGIGTFSSRVERHDLNSPQGSRDARIYGLK